MEFISKTEGFLKKIFLRVKTSKVLPYEWKKNSYSTPTKLLYIMLLYITISFVSKHVYFRSMHKIYNVMSKSFFILKNNILKKIN